MTAAKTRRHVIDISQHTKAWQRLPRAAILVRTAARAALQESGKALHDAGRRSRACEVSIVLTGNGAVRRLNRTYRGQDKPTNVLSFPAGAPAGDPLLLGDVVIAHGVAAAESRRDGKTLAAHLTHLVLHGVLHLLGYDHVRTKDTRIMERLESEIMARLGFADPHVAPPQKSRRPQGAGRTASRRKARRP